MAIYECESCRVLSSGPGDLCRPLPLKTSPCFYEPSAKSKAARRDCAAMSERLEAICESCGRPSVEAELLCAPQTLRE